MASPLPPRRDQATAGHAPIPLRPAPDAAPAPGHLPAAPTPLLGRDAEVDRLRAILWEAETRLLTLTGPGGVGKTRLALAVAEALVGHYADGVHFVDLSPVRDPAQVTGAVAAILGVKESSARPVDEALAAFLRDKDLLLVLDNCEQVADAASQFAAWLTQSPALVLLATSRASLRVRWERIIPVDPLALPGADTREPARVAESPAVALFVARAQAVRPDFALTAENAPAIAELCRRHDGLPLAIELVATQVRMINPQVIVARLAERQLPLAATWRDMPDRHRTLTEAIAWSYDLLAPDAQALFRRLGVFVGGCTIAAAEAVGGGDEAVPDPVAALLALIDQSLVRQVEGPDEPRFVMLETVREYAAGLLAASDEAPLIERRQADFFLALAERANRHYFAEGEARWLARLEADLANFRAALRWNVQHDRVEAGSQLACDLFPTWRANGHLREGYTWLTVPFAGQGTRLTRALAARVQQLAGLGCFLLGRYDMARTHALAGLACADTDPVGQGRLYNVLGLAQRMIGELAEARASFHTGMALVQCVPNNVADIAVFVNNLGGIAFDEGDFASAASYYTQAVALEHQLGRGSTLALILPNLAVARIVQGDLQVRDLLDESLALCRSLRVYDLLAFNLVILGFLAQLEQQFARTARLFGAAEAVRDMDGLPVPAAERPYHERVIAAARSALGEDAFAAHWATGRSWSLEEMFDYAAQREEAPIAPRAPVASESQPAVPVQLTRREREILVQVAAGRTNREIADHFSIGQRTVESHVANLFGKLGVANRVQATSLAAAWKLLP